MMGVIKPSAKFAEYFLELSISNLNFLELFIKIIGRLPRIELISSVFNIVYFLVFRIILQNTSELQV